jgi:hypothetical protein
MCNSFWHCSIDLNNKMWRIFVHIFLVHYIETRLISMNSIGIIQNVSLVMFNTNSTTINSTSKQCLCAILLNITSCSSFNCFKNNNTCEIFLKPLETGSFTLVNSSASSFYFFPFSINDMTSTIAPITQSSSISRSSIVLVDLIRVVFALDTSVNLHFQIQSIESPFQTI